MVVAELGDVVQRKRILERVFCLEDLGQLKRTLIGFYHPFPLASATRQFHLRLPQPCSHPIVLLRLQEEVVEWRLRRFRFDVRQRLNGCQNFGK